MGEFNQIDFGEHKLIASGDNSFYANDLEPLAGYDQIRNAPGDVNRTMNDGYGEEPLHTILPTIKQNKQMSESFKQRGLTKPSTLGNMPGYGNTKR